MPTNADTTMVWTNVKHRFRVKDNRVIRASWEDNKDWIEIHLERKWKKMMNWASEILAPKDNRVLPRHLVVVVPKKRGIINRLKT